MCVSFGIDCKFLRKQDRWRTWPIGHHLRLTVGIRFCYSSPSLGLEMQDHDFSCMSKYGHILEKKIYENLWILSYILTNDFLSPFWVHSGRRISLGELHDQDKLGQKGQAVLEAWELTRNPCELNVSQYQAISLPESMTIGQILSDESIQHKLKSFTNHGMF